MKRNSKAINTLADFLAERGPQFFDMNNWYPTTVDFASGRHNCGTAACIGGSACFLWPSINSDPSFLLWETDLQKLARRLGITSRAARSLCCPKRWADRRRIPFKFDDVTLKNAVATLRRFARTGSIEFRWTER